MNISIERAGRFNATRTMIDNRHKCAAMKTKIYNYDVKIEAKGSHLSPEGYVFNNERVQTYFDDTFGAYAKPWDAMSCERMALKAAVELYSLLRSEGIKVKQVCATIIGSNGAKIQAVHAPVRLGFVSQFIARVPREMWLDSCIGICLEVIIRYGVYIAQFLHI